MDDLNESLLPEPTALEAHDGVMHVEFSRQLRERLIAVARASGQSEADLILEAIAESVSRKTKLHASTWISLQ